MLLAAEDSPVFFAGAFQSALGAAGILPKLAAAFRSGEGVGWHEHDHQLFHGTERFYRSGYLANLVSSRIPALQGMGSRLKAGGRADIGCGHGAITILVAQAFPNSSFIGFDYHKASIATAEMGICPGGVLPADCRVCVVEPGAGAGGLDRRLSSPRRTRSEYAGCAASDAAADGSVADLAPECAIHNGVCDGRVGVGGLLSHIVYTRLYAGGSSVATPAVV